MRFLVAGATLVLASAGSAQTPLRLTRVEAPLFDVVVVADSLYGVQVLASPGLASVSGYQRTIVTRFAIAETALSAWLPGGRRLADSAPYVTTVAPGRIAGVRLPADQGRSSITLGYNPMESVQKRFVIVFEDGASTQSWSARLPDSTARTFVSALADAVASSRLLAVADSGSPARALLACEVDEPPVMTKRPTLRYPDVRPFREGRVWAQYVIDTTGHVDLGSVQFLLSDGPGFEKEVLRALRAIRFSPAREGGASCLRVGLPALYLQGPVMGVRWLTSAWTSRGAAGPMV